MQVSDMRFDSQNGLSLVSFHGSPPYSPGAFEERMVKHHFHRLGWHQRKLFLQQLVRPGQISLVALFDGVGAETSRGRSGMQHLGIDICRNPETERSFADSILLG